MKVKRNFIRVTNDSQWDTAQVRLLSLYHSKWQQQVRDMRDLPL